MKEWNSEAVEDRIDDFLEPLLDASGLDLDYDVIEGKEEGELISPELTVDFSGPDVGLLLEHRGELLLALEHLTLEALHISHDHRYKLIFDAHDYRRLRIEELRMSAEAAAEKVLRTGRPFHFQPMSSRERRIIHVALNERSDVKTASEGVAPGRHLVVYPAD